VGRNALPRPLVYKNSLDEISGISALPKTCCRNLNEPMTLTGNTLTRSVFCVHEQKLPEDLCRISGINTCTLQVVADEPGEHPGTSNTGRHYEEIIGDIQDEFDDGTKRK